MRRPYDYDDQYDPEYQPEYEHCEQRGYDEYIYDEDEAEREEIALEHEIREAMEEEHEREVAERKKLGKSGPDEHD